MVLFRKLSKYKLVLQPLIFVLLLDVILLATNFWLSADIEASAVSINIAGRQRMLSQKITKSLAFIELSNNELVRKIHIAELKASVEMFNQTIDAFYAGGDAIDASGDPVMIEAQKESKDILIEAKQVWDPVYARFQLLWDEDTASINGYVELLSMMKAHNLALLKLMNDLTNNLEDYAEQRSSFLRTFQSIIVVIIFLSFLHAMTRYAKREAYYASLMEKTTDVVMSIDIQTGRFTFVSLSAKQVLGYDVDDLIDNTVDAIMTDQSKIAFKQILNEIKQTGTLTKERYEADLIAFDGSIIHTDVVLDLTLSEMGNRQELSADFRDISERKSAEQRLEALAHKDSLTGLSNRHTFIELLEHSIQRCKRTQSTLAVLFIDLDGFKLVNDSFGHETGDALLIELAARMKQCLRDSDHVARMGGDEFTVLLEDVNTQAEVAAISEKLLDQISIPYSYDKHTCHVTASIGCAFYQIDVDANELIRQADQAMYDVKFNGKNAVSFS